MTDEEKREFDFAVELFLRELFIEFVLLLSSCSLSFPFLIARRERYDFVVVVVVLLLFSYFSKVTWQLNPQIQL